MLGFSKCNPVSEKKNQIFRNLIFNSKTIHGRKLQKKELEKAGVRRLNRIKKKPQKAEDLLIILQANKTKLNHTK